jgi:GAF domain-containing protein
LVRTQKEALIPFGQPLKSSSNNCLKFMTTPVPPNEQKRLKVLWQYEILDTVPEEVFDDLTDLAARICNVPMAKISLVDEDRQWFKSRIGIRHSETARNIAFCAHAILQKELFIVPDAARDARFAHSPLVKSGPKIRFYAGAPLTTPDGYALGALCVMDRVPRRLSENQQQALLLLARLVMTQLELRRHSKELAKSHARRDKVGTDLDKVMAQLAAARCELARYKAQLRKPRRPTSPKKRR